MILALETSSSLCAVSLYDDEMDVVVAEVSNNIGRGHAERLMDDIEEALKLAGLTYKDITLLACGVGPGSFTGIRVGVAAARGFGLALKAPVHGVTSLQAIGLKARQDSHGRQIHAAIDASRDEVYLQTFDANAAPLDNPRAVRIEDLAGCLPEGPVFICGSGSKLFDSIALPERAAVNPNNLVATAPAVAKAAANPAMRVAPKPLYLRAPDAKPQAGFAIARR
jgi:tRNA threonylcarbamoyladenosine biosynthesis protein TsaB